MQSFQSVKQMCNPPRGGGGEAALQGILGGGVLPGSRNPDPISEYSKIHTHLQTWPLREKLLSLLRLERQQIFSNPFQIRILLFLSYSSGIETTKTSIHFRNQT